MEQSLSELADDVESLRAIIASQAEELARQSQRLRSRDTLIEKLKAQLAVLKRVCFGTSSEKNERSIAQLELALEDMEAAEAEIEISARSVSGSREKAKPSRQPLPDHLPRQEVVHQAACACPVCGGADFIRNGEAVTEVLDYFPASFRVERHVQPRFTCKGRDTDIKAPMPSLHRCIRKPTSQTSRASCMPMAMPGSTTSMNQPNPTNPPPSRRRPAERMSAASSLI
ncbi:IS66 family transposase [Sinorhizobium meliloti]|uniref:IS66 family transposase n=1 Tax=Rhizobium meliloti TaxID=382 RepID=UPI0039889233